MMGMRLPETCWAVFKRQLINMRNCCIWLVDSFEWMQVFFVLIHLLEPRLRKFSMTSEWYWEYSKLLYDLTFFLSPLASYTFSLTASNSENLFHFALGQISTCHSSTQNCTRFEIKMEGKKWEKAKSKGTKKLMKNYTLYYIISYTVHTRTCDLRWLNSITSHATK